MSKESNENKNWKIIINLFFSLRNSSYICPAMKTVQLTIQEIRMATRPNVYKSKKTYTRKVKHKTKEYEKA